MPVVMETYAGVQDLPMAPPAAVSAHHHHRRQHRASSSSRAERRQSSRRHPHRHSREESNTTSSSGSSGTGETKNKLADLFIETKIEMMRMVEDDLKLKLDVRQMKECFFSLLKNFEAFEKQEIAQPDIVTSALKRQDRIRHSSQRPRISRRLSRASSDALQESSGSVRCPNNTRLTGNNETASMMTIDYSRSNTTNVIDESGISDVIGASRVGDLSAITQCSNATYREQCSQSRIIDTAGPLSSTIRYPQFSTPEKKRQHNDGPISPIAGRVQDLHEQQPTTHRRRLQYDRPAPTGADAPIPAAALILRSTASDSDATPVAVRTITRLPRTDRDGSDSGLCGSDTPTSRHHFRSVEDLSLEAVTPMPQQNFMESLKALQARLRRQTAQPCLSQELRSPVGLSETDFLEASSLMDGTMLDLQCSTNATRASVANISAFSTSPVSPSSRGSSSPEEASSYKESDATTSSVPEVSSRTQSRKHVEARDQRYHNRQMAALSTYTSGTSTSSYGGIQAPSNSPNATSESYNSTNISSKLQRQEGSTTSATSASRLRVSRSSSSRQHQQHRVKKEAYLGSRPPCIGSDVFMAPAVAPSLPPQAPPRSAISDPETSRVSHRHLSLYAYKRAARREQQQSGASGSSGGSSFSSDQSGASAAHTSKESTVTCIGLSATPTKAGSGVRRSLSKRIKKLGKKIMKTNSRAKADVQHSI